MKTFVITGANRGIGLELARQALEAGDAVVAIARDPSKSAELQTLLKKHEGKAVAVKADLRDAGEVASLQTAVRTFKPSIDVLINNAGIYNDGDSGFEELSDESVRESFEVNVLGPMRVTRALLPVLESGADPKVVNITSLMGSIGDNESGGSYGYRMSKAALNMFTKSFAVDHPRLTAIVVHPGWVQTRMGGAGAPTPAADSARGILRVIQRAKHADSGSFYDFEGERLPW